MVRPLRRHSRVAAAEERAGGHTSSSSLPPGQSPVTTTDATTAPCCKMGRDDRFDRPSRIIHVGRPHVREASHTPTGGNHALPSILRVVGARNVVPVWPERGRVARVRRAVRVPLHRIDDCLARLEPLKVEKRGGTLGRARRGAEVDTLVGLEQLYDVVATRFLGRPAQRYRDRATDQPQRAASHTTGDPSAWLEVTATRNATRSPTP